MDERKNNVAISIDTHKTLMAYAVRRWADKNLITQSQCDQILKFMENDSTQDQIDAVIHKLQQQMASVEVLKRSLIKNFPDA